MKKLLLLALFATQAPADTLGEEKRFIVNQMNQYDFEVIRLRHMAAAELWCAAASHVETRLRLTETSPIYVRRPLGPATTELGRKGVVFSLSRSGLPADDPSRLTVTVEEPGAMLKSAQARRFCRDAFTRSTK